MIESEATKKCGWCGKEGCQSLRCKEKIALNRIECACAIYEYRVAKGEISDYNASDYEGMRYEKI
jgi:hypothetical protein